MSNSETPEQPEAIAIIGMAGRFPGAAGIAQFWENLRNGVESITFFSDDELLAAGADSALLSNANYVKAAAVLEGVDMFDAAFFGATPREAEIMDPQQRLFLECAWQAIENAGYDTQRDKGLIGVYAGMSMNTYWMNLFANARIARTVSRFQIGIVNDKDHLPTRVSYKLDLKGPSVNVQTACSTSLVAVHMACQSLLNGECDMALAGGVSITFPQRVGYIYEEGGINSPDGHCRAFDAEALGTVGGNGVGVVVLKRLAEALDDGDTIYAVIKGSAINNDGSMKVGYTAPSVDGQAKVIAEALAVAGVHPETISYIEAHGTGTSLGDPIEIGALTQVFRASTEKKNFCGIGSLKTNIGHLDAAAGVAGLIKAALSLHHKQLPPSLHYQKPNPKIDFAGSPFYVNSTLQDWRRGATPLRAGVSSFGIGGTNAHVVIEEAPEIEPSGPSRPWQLIGISAKTATAIEAAASNLAQYLDQNREVELADVAFTLLAGRRAFGHRQAVVCRDVKDAARLLGSTDAKQKLSRSSASPDRPVVFMFPGQGSQYVGMGSELYVVEETFREDFDECAEILNRIIGVDLRDLIYPQSSDEPEAEQKLNETFITQPALFVIEYALARLWMRWGVKPRGMIGHSIGEYVAACLAGVFSLPDALAIVAERGRLMQKLDKGAMLAVSVGEDAAKQLTGKGLAVAVVNGPSRCVMSGPVEAIDELEQQMNERGVACRRLHTSHAFHSPMMEPMLGAFAELMKRINMNRPKVAYISNLTGTWITTAEATDPNYWVAHLRQTVRFGEGLAELLKDPAIILLEVGPGQALTSLANLRKTGEQIVLGSLARVKEKYSDEKHLLNVLSRLWVEGVEIDWPNFYAGQRRRRLPLPTYPFERQRYFVEPSPVADARPKAAPSSAASVSPDGNHGSLTIRQSVVSTQSSPLVAELRAEEFKTPESVAEAIYYDSGDGSGDGVLEGIIERQLEIMSQQLFVLHANNQIGLPPSVAGPMSDRDSEIARGFSETTETA